MKHGKFQKRTNRKSVKVLSLVLAFVLVIGASVAGTLAWLTAQTETVTNTFTSAELIGTGGSFTLWENKATDTDGDGRYTLTEEKVTGGSGNSYDILPGVNIPKNPTVEVKNLEEYAYLYIKVTAKNFPTALTYSIDDKVWEQLTGYTDVWVFKGEYKAGTSVTDNVIPATDNAMVGFTANILTQSTDATNGAYAITVPATYTGADDSITLEFSAYMVQATGNGTSAAAAWENTFPDVGTKIQTS